MKPLNRETLGVELRERLIERFGTIARASEKLGMDYDQLRAAYSRKQGYKAEGLTPPLRVLKRLGYEVHFNIVARGEQP